MNLPIYQSHKLVGAAKIDAVEVIESDGTGRLLLAAGDEVQVRVVTPEYMAKHEPKPGGYFVLYEDGYESFSPAEAFEAGYTPITADAPAPPPEPPPAPVVRGTLEPFLRRLAGGRANFSVLVPRGTDIVAVRISNFAQTDALEAVVVGDTFTYPHQ